MRTKWRKCLEVLRPEALRSYEEGLRTCLIKKFCLSLHVSHLYEFLHEPHIRMHGCTFYETWINATLLLATYFLGAPHFCTTYVLLCTIDEWASPAYGCTRPNLAFLPTFGFESVSSIMCSIFSRATRGKLVGCRKRRRRNLNFGICA